MAIIWQHNRSGIHYEVRSAGASVRLYTNGAFHSQYNPRYIFTGAIWDLLSLPSLALEPSPANCLILGVGGGTVIHQLNHLGSPANIIGLELDPVHLKIAKQHFRLNYSNLQLVECDARAWLLENTSETDYLVDDIFLHGESDPERPFVPDAEWLNLLVKHLSADGMLVQNHIDLRHATAFLDSCMPAIKAQFGSVFMFRNRGYDNAVLAFYRQKLTQRELNLSIRASTSALGRGQAARLRFSSRRIL